MLFFTTVLLFAPTELVVLIRRSLDQHNIVVDTRDMYMKNSTEKFYWDLFGQADIGSLVAKRPGSASNSHSCGQIRTLPPELRSAAHMHPHGLTQFYQKYTEAYGIPIVSSENAADAALIRACYVVRFMLADRYDIRNEMYLRYGRVGVIGVHELTTDIPEHSWLDSWWDTRARGLGPTDYYPICTNSEENLLCYGYPPDRWHSEDIMVHEVAHSVHLLGAKYVINNFEQRLHAIYDTRKDEKSQWANTYAMTNHVELFAEAAQIYFNVNGYASDGIHNDVNTRDKLKTYDPQLYALVQEVFPCANVIVDRCGSSGKRKRKKALRTQCVSRDNQCKDRHRRKCKLWKNSGNLRCNERKHKRMCRKTCDVC